MGDIQPQLEALGVGMAIVGSGSVGHARDFQAERKLTIPLFVDPGLRAFQAFQLKHGVGATFGPNAIRHGLRAFFGGHRQGAVMGDPWQQGGVLLVMPDGATPYAYRSQEAGDHPDPRAVVEAVRQAVGPRA